MASSSAPILSDEERLQAKLTLLANVAVGFVEGLQEVSGKTIARIEKICYHYIHHTINPSSEIGQQPIFTRGHSYKNIE